MEENTKLEQDALEKLLTLLLLWGQAWHLYSLEARLLEVLSSRLGVVVIFASFFIQILQSFISAVQDRKSLANAGGSSTNRPHIPDGEHACASHAPTTVRVAILGIVVGSRRDLSR